MNQLNIFGEIDYIDNNGDIIRCCMCSKSIKQGQLCDSEDCANEWLEKYIINGLN